MTPIIHASHLGAMTLAIVGLATASLAIAAPGNGRGDPHVDPIVGVWEATVTQHHCVSGAPLAVFKGLQALHHGGTLSDTNASGPTTRGPGFGYWYRDGDGYVAKFRFARYFPDGNLAGFNVVTRKITLAADGDSLTSESRVQIQAPDGTVVGAGCASDVSTRFK